jgi:transposase
LEDVVKVALVNPYEVKARRGHKTDPKDAWWLAHLLRHAMVTPSFIPPRWQRELRDLTRRRRKVIHTATSEKNPIEKTLEDANVKLSSVLSDIFGVSGQLMLEALLKGKADPTQKTTGRLIDILWLQIKPAASLETVTAAYFESTNPARFRKTRLLTVSQKGRVLTHFLEV